MREVVEEDDDREEMFRGCSLNMLESKKEWNMSDSLCESELCWGSGDEGGEEIVGGLLLSTEKYFGEMILARLVDEFPQCPPLCGFNCA